MRCKYFSKGTCSDFISFDLEDGIVRNIQFRGGCNGNLKALSIVLDGWKAEDIINKVKGVKCGNKNTSCSDQLACALQSSLEKCTIQTK